MGIRDTSTISRLLFSSAPHHVNRQVDPVNQRRRCWWASHSRCPCSRATTAERGPSTSGRDGPSYSSTLFTSNLTRRSVNQLCRVCIKIQKWPLIVQSRADKRAWPIKLSIALSWRMLWDVYFRNSTLSEWSLMHCEECIDFAIKCSVFGMHVKKHIMQVFFYRTE